MEATAKSNLNTEKAKALQAALAQIEKQFGKGSIMRLGEGEVIEDMLAFLDEHGDRQRPELQEEAAEAPLIDFS